MLFKFQAECNVCGKKGFRMNKQNQVFCKRHWQVEGDC